MDGKFDECLELFVAHCEHTGQKDLLETDQRYSIYFVDKSFMIGHEDDKYLVWEIGSLPDKIEVITCKSRPTLPYFHDNLLRIGFSMKDDLNVIEKFINCISTNKTR